VSLAKTASIEQLLISATKCFGQLGYEGAALRTIAADAGVTLSAIGLYFGGKAELYLAAKRQIALKIQEERLALIEAAFDAGQGRPSQDALVAALVEPIITRAVHSTEVDRYSIQLFRNAVVGQPHPVSDSLIAGAELVIERWIEGMRLAQPQLSEAALAWAYSFVVSVALSGQVVDERLRRHDASDRAEDVVADVVAFCSAGISAMGRRRDAGRPASEYN
jgi:AcrR family transcriptional regulator